MFLDIENYKISQYVDPQYDDLPCHLIDFKRHLIPTVALSKRVSIDEVSMRPIQAVYSYAGEDLVKLKWTFSVDAMNLMTHRKREICYVLNDGTYGDWFCIEDQSFDMNLPHQRNQVIAERETSRHALINDIKTVLLGILQVTQPTENPIELGGQMIKEYSSEIDSFVQTGSDQFKTAVINDITFAWLNDIIDSNGTTIRMYILSRLG